MTGKLRGRSYQAAVISLILVLPFMTLLMLTLWGREPDLTVFAQKVNLSMGYFNSLIIMSAFLMIIPALFLNILAVVRHTDTGNHQTKPWINLILAFLFTGAILTVIILVMLDQYPCWVGMPNCD